MTIEENFEYLHSTECSLFIRTIAKDAIIIDVENLTILKGHPVSKENEVVLPKCVLKFTNISYSKREIHEYFGDPKAGVFREKFILFDIEDGGSQDDNAYEFEGIMHSPLAWVDWIIKAGGFELEIPLTYHKFSEA